MLFAGATTLRTRVYQPVVVLPRFQPAWSIPVPSPHPSRSSAGGLALTLTRQRPSAYHPRKNSAQYLRAPSITVASSFPERYSAGGKTNTGKPYHRKTTDFRLSRGAWFGLNPVFEARWMGLLYRPLSHSTGRSRIAIGRYRLHCNCRRERCSRHIAERGNG